MSIRRIGRSARKLDPAAKFIPWFNKYELVGPNDDDDDDDDDDEIDDIIGDPDYVPTL